MQTPLPHVTDQWPPTRAEALRRMNAFVPRAGRRYAAERNIDYGPQRRSNVSVLSPYLRRRIVTETEVLRAVAGAIPGAQADKFVQEVFWRTYWKGWMEQHPAAWHRYRETTASELQRSAGDARLRDAYAAAVEGRTGIDAFDAWVHELRGEHYLHNHARMWFASIWIFTLELPWELGADFFMRELLDGDPASNTLSWRWVAGLHTRGKTYAARRDNIARYTEGRFRLDRPLATTAHALEDAPIARVPLPLVPGGITDNVPSLLVLHEDDLAGDLVDLPRAGIRGVCALETSADRSPAGVSAGVVAFGRAAAAAAVERAAVHTGSVALETVAAGAGAAHLEPLLAAARSCGAERIVAPFAPIGPARSALDAIAAGLAAAGVGYAEFGRRFDAVAWPAAAGGYFKLRERIPAILADVGVAAG